MPDALDELIAGLGLDASFARRFDDPPLHPVPPAQVEPTKDAPLTAALLFNEDQPRGPDGRWGDGGGTTGEEPARDPFKDVPDDNYTPNTDPVFGRRLDEWARPFDDGHHVFRAMHGDDLARIREEGVITSSFRMSPDDPEGQVFVAGDWRETLPYLNRNGEVIVAIRVEPGDLENRYWDTSLAKPLPADRIVAVIDPIEERRKPLPPERDPVTGKVIDRATTAAAFYSEDQPRDDNGRFAGGGNDPQAEYDGVETREEAVAQAIQAWKTPTLPAPIHDGRHYDVMGHANAMLRGESLPTFKEEWSIYPGDYLLAEKHRERAAALVDAIREAPPSDAPLYRGVALPTERGADGIRRERPYQEGDTVPSGLHATSSNPAVARSFGTQVFVYPEGTRALDTEQYSKMYDHEDEFIVDGTGFVVDRVEKVPGEVWIPRISSRGEITFVHLRRDGLTAAAFYSEDQPRDALGRFGEGGGEHGKPGETEVGVANSERLHNEFLNYNLGRNGSAALQERGAAKGKLVGALGAGIESHIDTNPVLGMQLQDLFPTQPTNFRGLEVSRPEAAAQMYVDQWTQTAADHDPTAIALQETVASELGARSDSFTGEPRGGQSDVGQVLEEQGEIMRTFVREEYDQTQAALRDAGFAPDDQITLYRGMGLPEHAPEWGDHPVDLNPASSWTTDRYEGERFAQNTQGLWDGSAQEPTLLTMTVPVTDILSTARTGRGALMEHEIIVLNRPDHVAKFDRLEKYGSPLVGAAGRRKKIYVDGGLNADWIKQGAPDVMVPVKRPPGAPLTAALLFNEDQPRDEQGQWTADGGGSGDRDDGSINGVPAKPEWAEGVAWETNQAAKDQWERELVHGLSMGKVTAEQAETLGYYGKGRGEDWQPLPSEPLYHVTTAMDAVQIEGLKTRDELSQQYGVGLGGGASNTISFTTDREMAETVEYGIREMREVARGEITAGELLERAFNPAPDEAPRPFVEDMMRSFTSSSGGWKTGDPIPQGVQDLVNGVSTDFKSILDPMTADEMAKHGLTPQGEPVRGADGIDRFMQGSRPMTEDKILDKTVDFYKTYAVWRGFAGGRTDPLFFTSDTKALANIAPEQIGTLAFEAKPGAQGYPLGAMAEWRTGSGDAVRPLQREEPRTVRLGALGIVRLTTVFWNEDQPRDENGRFAGGGAGPTWDEAKAKIREASKGTPYGTKDPAAHAASTTTDHPRFYYHMSKSTNRESIQSNGLEADRSLGGKYRRVYLAEEDPKIEPRLDTAGMDTWKVDTRDVPLRPDPEAPDAWAISEQDIPADRLVLVATTKPDDPLRAAGFFNEDQPRDERGRFGETGGGGGKDRLQLRAPGERLGPKAVVSKMQRVVNDVGRFYGSDKKATVEPDTYGVLDGGAAGARDRVLADSGEGQIIYVNPYDIEKMRDPDGGVLDFRMEAHEAVHALVSGEGAVLPGISKTVEEGAAEILSLHYWNERGQELGPDDRRTNPHREEGGDRWTEVGVPSLAASTVYHDEVTEVLARSASRVGWDQDAVVADVLDVMRSDHGGRLAFRDSSDPEFPPPDGVQRDAPSLVEWLLTKPVRASAAPETFYSDDQARDEQGRFAGGGGGLPKDEDPSTPGRQVTVTHATSQRYADEIRKNGFDVMHGGREGSALGKGGYGSLPTPSGEETQRVMHEMPDSLSPEDRIVQLDLRVTLNNPFVMTSSAMTDVNSTDYPVIQSIAEAMGATQEDWNGTIDTSRQSIGEGLREFALSKGYDSIVWRDDTGMSQMDPLLGDQVVVFNNDQVEVLDDE